MKTPKQSQPGTADLLLLADSIQGQARQLENLATWRNVLLQNEDAKMAGEHLDMTALLREIQASRFAGTENDAGFFIVCHMAERHAETVFQTDAALDGIHDKMEAIRKREDADWDLDDPDAPEDYRTLAGQWSRRFDKLEQVRETRFIGWLRRHGATEMADLYANDRAAFDRRREAGRCKVYGPMPDINADIGEGDTGLTEVVEGEK
jgi:hypothetical protein